MDLRGVSSKAKRLQKVPDASDILSKYELDQIDRKILELRLKYPTISDSEIAHLIGMTRKQVNKRKNKKAFQDALNQFTEEPISILNRAMNKAARVVARALDSADERLKVSTALKMLISHGAIKVRHEVEPQVFEPFIIDRKSVV